MFELHIRDNFYLIWSTSQNDRVSIRENEEASASDTTSLKRKYFPSRQKLLAKYSPKFKIISTKNSSASFLFHELTGSVEFTFLTKYLPIFPFQRVRENPNSKHILLSLRKLIGDESSLI